MKPVKRMEYYYKLDQQIVNNYVQMLKDTEVLDCGETTQESLNACTNLKNGGKFFLFLRQNSSRGSYITNVCFT